MQQVLRDTAGLGTFFWLIGYLAGIVLFLTPFRERMGWILFGIFTPVTIAVTWWWFRNRKPRALRSYAGVGLAWALIAIILDYLFIVLLFGPAAYYQTHVILYYGFMVLIPVIVGMYLNRSGAAREK
jgi:hypothetical protein